jgi:hypothetical protein
LLAMSRAEKARLMIAATRLVQATRRLAVEDSRCLDGQSARTGQVLPLDQAVC